MRSHNSAPPQSKQTSRADLRRATELRPGLYRVYAALERHIGHTLSPARVPLPELTGIPPEPATVPAPPAPGLRGREAPRPRDASCAG